MAFGPRGLDAVLLTSLAAPVLSADFNVSPPSIEIVPVELDFVRSPDSDSPDGKVRTPPYDGFIIVGAESILRAIQVASAVEVRLRARRTLTGDELRALQRTLNRAMTALEGQGFLGSSLGWTIRTSSAGGSGGATVMAALALAGVGYYLTRRRPPKLRKPEVVAIGADDQARI
ncbi:hypothetical protein [Sandaracinus amylolyticus]|uniref:hypothetical protein n=1 Tax=Sandaracinus amylolyticus TaxID=927083 RepID=UPI0012ECFB52|nr:hypothetical protein [Sandaracinus amylolyticus]